MDNESIWKLFLDNLNQRISDVSFNTWFKSTTLISVVDNKIIIGVPMNFQKTFLMTNYYELIEEIFNDILKKDCLIELVSEDELNEKESKINEITNQNINYKYDYNLNSNLNPNYTFDSFMIGDSNRFAYTSALTVAQNPGKIYNPFFLYGKSGLGKTHLMHAIGNYIVQNLNLKVLYVTSEQFKNDFVDIYKSDGSNDNNQNNIDFMNSFKDKYRSIDVLIIDDIQFFKGLEKTRQEFFHTFEYLKNLNRQIIISSDRSPDDLKFLEDRLKTRFSWGLTADIYPPDYHLKVKIIKNKIKDLVIFNNVPDEVLDFIANNSENDVRHLEGAITRLMAYAALMNKKNIDLVFTNEALQDFMLKNSYIKGNISKIQKAVADYYDLTVDDLKGKKRNSEINYPRQVAIYLCRMITDETTTKIGIEFGGKSHSTIIHSCKKINDDIKSNPQLEKMIEDIKTKIN